MCACIIREEKCKFSLKLLKLFMLLLKDIMMLMDKLNVEEIKESI